MGASHAGVTVLTPLLPTADVEYESKWVPTCQEKHRAALGTCHSKGVHNGVPISRRHDFEWERLQGPVVLVVFVGTRCQPVDDLVDISRELS